MSKLGSYAARKGAPHHRRRRGKRQPSGMKPALPGGQRVSPQKSIATGSTVSSPEVRSRNQQVAPDFTYVRSDLIRIGIITAGMLLILAILWLVL